ncbi:MAG TPA: hypothetical protein VF170_15295, partial [Planctomycetaceae bacterium]
SPSPTQHVASSHSFADVWLRRRWGDTSCRGGRTVAGLPEVGGVEPRRVGKNRRGAALCLPSAPGRPVKL